LYVIFTGNYTFLRIPSGFNIQPISVKYLGFADVLKGGNAYLKVKILFQGQEVPTNDNPNQKLMLASQVFGAKM